MPSVAKKISKFTKSEIDYLFSRARRIVKNQACTILMAPRQNQNYARVLIVVSRKVAHAPGRNLIRRRIKSIFYEEKLFTYNFDCVVIAYHKMVALSFDELKSILISAYHKVLHEDEGSVS